MSRELTKWNGVDRRLRGPVETEVDRRAGVMSEGGHLCTNVFYESRTLFFPLEKISRALEEDGNLRLYVVSSQFSMHFVPIQPNVLWLNDALDFCLLLSPCLFHTLKLALLGEKHILFSTPVTRGRTRLKHGCASEPIRFPNSASPRQDGLL